MKSQNTIEFKDVESNEEGVAVLTKQENGAISIALSLKQDGDIAVVLPQEKALEIKNGLGALLGEPPWASERRAFFKRGLLIMVLILIAPLFWILVIHTLLIIGFSAYHLLNG